MIDFSSINGRPIYDEYRMGDMSKNCSKENVSPQKGETFSFL